MFDFNFDLGDDIDLLRESVADFAADRIAPRAAAIDDSNEFPRDLWPELGAMGLLGITVEERDGGAGLGYLAARCRHGGDQPGVGVGRIVVRGAFEFMR